MIGRKLIITPDRRELKNGDKLTPCYIYTKVAASEGQDTKIDSGTKNNAVERETGGLNGTWHRKNRWSSKKMALLEIQSDKYGQQKHKFGLVQFIPDFKHQCVVLESHCEHCGLEVFDCIKNEERIDKAEDGSYSRVYSDTPSTYWDKIDETCRESYQLAKETPCVKERKDTAAVYNGIQSRIDECLVCIQRTILSAPYPYGDNEP